MARAILDAGGRLPTDLASEKAASNRLVQRLLDVAHGTTSYNQAMPGFYSRLARAVETSTQAKASGAQWKATVRNSKGGINADEFALTNVADLDDATVYTRAEVLQYLAANEIEVEPIELAGAAAPTERAVTARAEELFEEQVDRELQRMEQNDDFQAMPWPEAEARFNDVEGKWEAFLVDGEDEEDVGVWYDTQAEAQQVADTERDKREQQLQDDRRAQAADRVSYGDAVRQARRQLEDAVDPSKAPRYADYVLPGPADDYREVLLAGAGFGPRAGESYAQLAQRMMGKPSSELTV